jgi:hypothetical protein
VPSASNPQNWNRYSYVINNPLRFNDPTGHKTCAPDEDGGCNKIEEFGNYVYDTLERLGGKNDRKAMTNIVRKAQRLYKTFDKLIPALSGIFLGVEESNPDTILHAKNANPCAPVGHPNCAANAAIGAFGDKGFNRNFQDGFSQPFHFWTYLSTAANTQGAGQPGGYLSGQIMGNVGNIVHEIIQPDGKGATWQDYALARAGMNIGGMINRGEIQPNELAGVIDDFLGTDGPRADYVIFLKAIAPLEGNR